MTRSGLMVMAVDNLPAEMAREASQYFGTALYPFVDQLVRTGVAAVRHPAPVMLMVSSHAARLSHGMQTIRPRPLHHRMRCLQPSSGRSLWTRAT